ncbi:MAG: chorismate mutase [Lachnospiraceae bacterium]|jgi:chorismate mutase/prephenate dehydratase|nr:chorismate mutase [Lachnospiraceae bacterium]
MKTTTRLTELREQMNDVTQKIVDLFQERQNISEEIGKEKEKNNLAILDLNRENEVIENVLKDVSDANKMTTTILVRELLALSRLKQSSNLELSRGNDLPKSEPIPEGPVAFQGVPGAWGEQAAGKLFPDREVIECEYFEDVFAKIKNGEAACGVVPIENSRTGAIGEVYDLLRKNSCYIVGQMWVKIRQSLLGVPGTTLHDVREILSHREALNQCGRFLKKYNWDLFEVSNTAVAAKTVTERGEKRVAAIGSRRAAELYGLEVLEDNISDDLNNRTRFIVIAAKPCYDENSTMMSVTFSTQHRSGALAAVLEPIGLYNINLSRIESRPVSPGSYRFFADIETSPFANGLDEAIATAASQAEYFEILGCYDTKEEE